MKQIFILGLLLHATLMIHAQEGIAPYVFSSSTGNSYSPIVNGTLATDGVPWDDPVLSIPIGFTFSFLGTVTDTIYFSDYFLGGAVSPSNGNAFDAFSPYFSDIIDRGNLTGVSESPIVYTTEGNPGSRIFKMEWQNAGFFNELEEGGVSENFVNFQLWLYEGSNDFEYHYGPGQVDGNSIYDLHDNFSGPVIGVFTNVNVLDDTADSIFFLQGVANNPTLESIDLGGFQSLSQVLNDHPVDGTIYRFSTGTVAVESILRLPGLNIFPQPATDKLQLILPHSEKAFTLQLFNYAGQLVMPAHEYEPGRQTLSIDHLPSGIYQLFIHTEEQVYSQKIVIQ